MARLHVDELKAAAVREAPRPRRSRRPGARARRRSARGRRPGTADREADGARGERRRPFQTSGRAKRPECVSCSPRYRSASAFAPNRSRCASISSSRSAAIDRWVAGRQQQLIRIRAAVVPHRDRLAAPHQLCAADAEVPPPPAGQVARLAVAACRPTLPWEGCRSGCRRARRPASNGCANAPAGSTASSNSRGMVDRLRCSRNAAAVLREATRGYSVRPTRDNSTRLNTQREEPHPASANVRERKDKSASANRLDEAGNRVELVRGSNLRSP